VNKAASIQLQSSPVQPPRFRAPAHAHRRRAPLPPPRAFPLCLRAVATPNPPTPARPSNPPGNPAPADTRAPPAARLTCVRVPRTKRASHCRCRCCSGEKKYLFLRGRGVRFPRLEV
uniref:Uncharacterized protein n=1 Tax=Aegilops tauschii subsp. strangulata TaxID=200361 RepID=A0A453RCC0_AEGTS